MTEQEIRNKLKFIGDETGSEKRYINRFRLYRIWNGMKRRCHSTIDDKATEHYRDRGISVCPEWRSSFWTFADWALSNGYEKSLTIDRVETLGNYEPGNCRWIPQAEQALNTIKNVIIEYNGEKKCVSEWAKFYGIKHETFWYRVIRNKMPMEKAIKEGNLNDRKVTINGETYNIKGWAKRLSMTYSALTHKLSRFGYGILEVEYKKHELVQ